MNVRKDRRSGKYSKGMFFVLSRIADCEWLNFVVPLGWMLLATVRTRVVVCFATAYPTLLMMMMLELELAAWRKLNTGSVKHKFLRPCGVFSSFVLIGLVVNFKRKANFGLGMIFIFIFTFVLVSLPVWRDGGGGGGHRASGLSADFL